MHAHPIASLDGNGLGAIRSQPRQPRSGTPARHDEDSGITLLTSDRRVTSYGSIDRDPSIVNSELARSPTTQLEHNSDTRPSMSNAQDSRSHKSSSHHSTIPKRVRREIKALFRNSSKRDLGPDCNLARARGRGVGSKDVIVSAERESDVPKADAKQFDDPRTDMESHRVGAIVGAVALSAATD